MCDVAIWYKLGIDVQQVNKIFRVGKRIEAKMRSFFVILGFAANMLFFANVYAAPHLVQTHDINIVVECVDEALEAISRLGGHNLHMDVTAFEQLGLNPIRQAEIIRRIDASEYRMAQNLLRSLGTVTSESESARNVGSDISDLQLRINSASGEFDRISHMMAESDSLHMLIALESRLSDITRSRDSLIGSLNVLLAESGTALISIHLAEDMGVFVPPPGPSFGARISASFFGSWNVTLLILQGIVLFIAYALIPAIFLSLLFFPIRAVIRAVNRSRGKRRVLAWQRYYAANAAAIQTSEANNDENSKPTEVQDV